MHVMLLLFFCTFVHIPSRYMLLQKACCSYSSPFSKQVSLTRSSHFPSQHTSAFYTVNHLHTDNILIAVVS